LTLQRADVAWSRRLRDRGGGHGYMCAAADRPGLERRRVFGLLAAKGSPGGSTASVAATFASIDSDIGGNSLGGLVYATSRLVEGGVARQQGVSGCADTRGVLRREAGVFGLQS